MADETLQGRTAIVTGASKGVGYAIAEALARAGANVVICSRTPDEVTAAAQRLDEAGSGTVVGQPCDMQSAEEVAGLVTGAVERFGGLDILINNAGVGIFAPVEEMTPQQWRQVLGTNLDGVFYACHAAIPHLKRSDSAWIINIGSLAGTNAFAGGAAYIASKAALIRFTEAMMLDVRHDGIRVSSILPGSVETHFNNNTPDGSAAWKIQPEDIAAMVMHLLATPGRTLPSRVDMRPSQPPRK